MPPQKYWWITGWFIFTIPIILWDAGYCLMRPRSLVGGDLRWFWKFYELYESVDLVYGVEAYEKGEGFSNAAAVLNIVEILAGLVYILAVYVVPSELAPLYGYTSATMTLSKTILYVAQEFFCGGCSVGHNDPNTKLFMWTLPNIMWASLSALTMWRLGSDVAASLRIDNSRNAAKKKA